MALVPGTRIGVYEITALLGEGGMGQVYRATDTRLKRQVAIKVLPPAVAGDAERLTRFQREAEVLAALNHPHIAAIYGLEESAGVSAIVMELVEGEDLAQRLVRSALPLDEALPIARQIAEALEAAHEQGIIHRDLKPANIKVRADGTVKVLDFGLAKALTPAPASDAAAAGAAAATITSPAHLRQGYGAAGTEAGMILGTAAYMSPEQAKGRPADKRSDVWAFGCVLYEMLSGQRAFNGDDVADTLALVLRGDVDLEQLPALVPPSIRALIRGCLRKTRSERIGGFAAALFVLTNITSLAPSSPLEGSVSKAQAEAAVAELRRDGARATRRRVALVGAAALLAGAVVAGLAVSQLTRPLAPSVTRTTVATSGPTALVPQGSDRDIAITPDGSRIVYRGDGQLLVRALNQLEPTVLSGLGAPHSPFLSPDGQWVGFFDGTTIKKVAIAGGAPVIIASPIGAAARGATWGPDGTIVFATSTQATALQRVSAAGGEPAVLTTRDHQRGDFDHLWPEFLPGGAAVLFTITVGDRLENAQIAVLDLQTGISRVVIRGGSDARYVPTGHLVYAFAGTLRAVAFDLERLEVVGPPVPVLQGMSTTLRGAGSFAVGANGSLVYLPGVDGGGSLRTVVSVDRAGVASPLPGLPLDAYRDVRVSPDGKRIALGTETDVWIYDVARTTLARLTTDNARSPLWTPDSQRIVFTSRRAGFDELFWRAADGSGQDERLFAGAKDLLDLRANGWAANGTHLLYTEVPLIGQMAIERPSDASVLVKNAGSYDFATVSPAGSWMAYHSSMSGRSEIYVERYPELGNRQVISTGGGRLPMWSGDGKELFFSSVDGRQMLAVAMPGTPLAAGRPHVLFEFAMLPQSAGNRPYDVAPDGRFFMIPGGPPESGGGSQNLVVVQNWFQELKRLVPAR